MNATKFFQDEVFSRTAYLVDVKNVFAADIYCHVLCIKNYLRSYATAVARDSKPSNDSMSSVKRDRISACIEEILPQLKSGMGFPLTYISKQLQNVRNRDVKMVLDDTFGDTISYVLPKEANKPTMFFLSSVSTEDVINTLRSKNEYVD